MGILTSFIIGIIFGAGTTLAGMINPSKVLNFLDVADDWGHCRPWV